MDGPSDAQRLLELFGVPPVPPPDLRLPPHMLRPWFLPRSRPEQTQAPDASLSRPPPLPRPRGGVVVDTPVIFATTLGATTRRWWSSRLPLSPVVFVTAAFLQLLFRSLPSSVFVSLVVSYSQGLIEGKGRGPLVGPEYGVNPCDPTPLQLEGRPCAAVFALLTRGGRRSFLPPRSPTLE